MTERRPSALYRYNERLQGERSWGSLLDAGTGPNSMRWIAGLATERWIAVTGSAREAELARTAAGEAKRPQDTIVQGNWADGGFLQDHVFDTVIADYLLGAIEGFAPFFQPYLFLRLRPLTRRTLYVTGLEPYVPTAPPDSPAGRLVWEIGRFRDASVLLKGGMPYREYPAHWVIDHMKRAGFTVSAAKHFNIGYKARFINAQIDIALHGLETLADQGLAQALRVRGEALRAQALDTVAAEGALRHCRNYVIAAEPSPAGSSA